MPNDGCLLRNVKSPLKGPRTAITEDISRICLKFSTKMPQTMTRNGSPRQPRGPHPLASSKTWQMEEVGEEGHVRLTGTPGSQQSNFLHRVMPEPHILCLLAAPLTLYKMRWETGGSRKGHLIFGSLRFYWIKFWSSQKQFTRALKVCGHKWLPFHSEDQALLPNASGWCFAFKGKRSGKNPQAGRFIYFLFFFIFWLYHTACGILVPWPGIEPWPPSSEGSES